MQLRVWHIARSVLSNWFATAATLAVGFLLAPFVVHRLGNVAYGVWVLAISSVNYLNLLDLGLRGSVLRFVSKGHTTQDHAGASEALSGALWIRAQLGGLVLILSAVLAWVFPAVFKIPPALALDARQAVIIIGVATGVTMSVGTVGGVLSALNRYDLQSYVTLTQLAIRVTGVVGVLMVGRGIVAIAVCELLAAAVGNTLLVFCARRVYPELKIQLAKPRPEVLRQIWSYSFYAFLLTVAGQLIYQTDNLVVGAFVSASAVTFYSIANSLCRYTQQLVYAMTATFNPAASTYESAGDTVGLRALYCNGTRASLALTLPVAITFLIRGRSFIAVWMGYQFSHTSGTVLVILATSLLFVLANSTAAAIAWGVEKHKKVAMWAIPEAVANFSLSIILAKKIGIYGVAIGTLVPSLVVQLILWPRYVSSLVGINWLQVYRRVWAPLFASAIPFAMASYAVDELCPARNMTIFVLQTILLLVVFATSVSLIFRRSIMQQLIPRIKSYFLRAQLG